MLADEGGPEPDLRFEQCLLSSPLVAVGFVVLSLCCLVESVAGPGLRSESCDVGWVARISFSRRLAPEASRLIDSQS